jgi:hypothetical protein
MGIAEGTPRQLAPSVGKGSIGLTVSPVSSSSGHPMIASAQGNLPTASSKSKSPTTVANSNSPARSTSINSKSDHSPKSPRRLTPHSMEAQQAFAGLESGLDITVGKFNFFVDKDGVQDLLDPLDMETLDTEVIDNASTATPSILGANRHRSSRSNRQATLQHP